MRASGELWEFKEVGVESVWLSVIFVKLVIVPTWGTTRAETSDLPKCDFNPRPHVGDDVIIGIITLLKKFQSTSPCGGRRGVVDSYDAGYTFQSTSPHGGRRVFAPCPAELLISIHVPVWGTTASAAVEVISAEFQSTSLHERRR